MNIQPRIKGVICTNADPQGCKDSVAEQARQVAQQSFEGPATALIIGASSGYGLATRVMLTFAGQTDTLGVYLDRAPAVNGDGVEQKAGTAGWYHTQALEEMAQAQGRWAKSINADAFAAATKAEVIRTLKAAGKKIGLLVYSVAAPRRLDEATGDCWRSVLKPVGQAVQTQTLDPEKGLLKPIRLEAATREEIAATVKVMGGEDWQAWVQALQQADLLETGCKMLAYTYIGASLTWPIYGDATIGHAKKDLDQTVLRLNAVLQPLAGRAHIAVLKALVTQASAAIPVMPLYISLLYRVMKEAGVHETCLEQIQRLFLGGLYGTGVERDDAGRFRLDEKELAPAIQDEIKHRWDRLTNDNLHELADFAGFRSDFLRLFGFASSGDRARSQRVTGEAL